MTPDDLALLVRLGLVEPTGAPGTYRLTTPGRQLAGEVGNRPSIHDTQLWRESTQHTTLRRIK